MNSPPTTAALTLSLTGPYEHQGTEAANGVRLWAEMADVQLTLVDDGGSRDTAVQAYTEWIDDIDLLLGPYSSGLVRAVAPVVRDAGRLLWNHGGSADDLAQPGVACLPAPASSYFHDIVDQAIARQVDQLVLVRGAGPFARAVAHGAATRASGRGLDTRTVDTATLELEDGAVTAVLIAGRYDHDLAVVRHLRDRRQTPALLAAVAAGIPAFRQELGQAAEGVRGPVQWWPTTHRSEIGPSGTKFATYYTGTEPATSLRTRPPKLPLRAIWHMPPTARAWQLRTSCGGKPRRSLVTSLWTTPGGRSAIASPRFAGLTAAWSPSLQLADHSSGHKRGCTNS